MSFHPHQELDACACSQVSKLSQIFNFTWTTIKKKQMINFYLNATTTPYSLLLAAIRSEQSIFMTAAQTMLAWEIDRNTWNTYTQMYITQWSHSFFLPVVGWALCEKQRTKRAWSCRSKVGAFLNCSENEYSTKLHFKEPSRHVSFINLKHA